MLDATMRLLARRRRPPTTALGDCQARADATAQALIRYRDNEQIAARVGQDAFVEGLTVRADRLRDANLALAEARARVAAHALPTVAEVRERLPTMPRAEQRELVSRVIDTVFVTAGRGPAPARVTICPDGTAPRLLPRPGVAAVPIVPITPRRDWINPQPS